MVQWLASYDRQLLVNSELMSLDTSYFRFCTKLSLGNDYNQTKNVGIYDRKRVFSRIFQFQGNKF